MRVYIALKWPVLHFLFSSTFTQMALNGTCVGLHWIQYCSRMYLMNMCVVRVGNGIVVFTQRSGFLVFVAFVDAVWADCKLLLMETCVNCGARRWLQPECSLRKSYKIPATSCSLPWIIGSNWMVEASREQKDECDIEETWLVIPLSSFYPRWASLIS